MSSRRGQRRGRDEGVERTRMRGYHVPETREKEEGDEVYSLRQRERERNREKERGSVSR